jgi:hypothetical protein
MLPESFEGQAASPDGAQLAVAIGQERIEILDAVSTKRRYAIATPHEEHNSYPRLFFSSDGRIVGSIRGPKTRLWEVATGKQISSLLPEGWTSMAAAVTPEGKILAIQQPHGDDSMFLRDALAAKTISRLLVPAPCMTAAMSADGRWAAAVERDTAVVVWDVNELSKTEPRTKETLSTQRLDRLWADLESEDAALAYRAVYALSHSPGQSVPFLDARLQAAKAPNTAKVQRWLQDLDDPNYAVRTGASEALDVVAELSRPALQRDLADHPSSEKRKRLEKLVEASEHWVPTPNRVRQWRAIMALEQANTAEAIKLLSKLAAGVPGHWLTEEARASLKRMAVRTRDR